MILAVQWQDALALVVALVALVYLVLVLIFPERF